MEAEPLQLCLASGPDLAWLVQAKLGWAKSFKLDIIFNFCLLEKMDRIL